jgi:hypothetical protein
MVPTSDRAAERSLSARSIQRCASAKRRRVRASELGGADREALKRLALLLRDAREDVELAVRRLRRRPSAERLAVDRCG